MDLTAPVSTIMTSQLITIGTEDQVKLAKENFETNKIHHLPVLKEEELVGMVSTTDLLHFLRYLDKDSQEPYLNDLRLKNYKVGEIMQQELVTVDVEDTIKAVLEVFQQNLFHALPVMKEGKLAGIVSTHDIIKNLVNGAAD